MVVLRNSWTMLRERHGACAGGGLSVSLLSVCHMLVQLRAGSGGILGEAGVRVCRSGEDRLFRSLCTHEDGLDGFRGPGVCRVPCGCGLVCIGEADRGLSLRLGEHGTNCEKAVLGGSAVAKQSWTNDHRVGWGRAAIMAIDSRGFSRRMRESVGVGRRSAVGRGGGGDKPLDGAWRALFAVAG